MKSVVVRSLALCGAILIVPLNMNAQNKVKQTAGREQLGDFAPEFARLNDDVLFGEVWSRTDRLGLRDRSLVTVVSLVSQGITDSSLTYHLQAARANGVTRSEIAEVVTQIGFYAGWPKAWAAFRLAKEVWREPAGEEASDGGRAAFARESIFPLGEPNTAYAAHFSGDSYLAPLSVASDARVFNVTFAPGCRNDWHVHRAAAGGGQILVAVAGRGLYQERGAPVRELRPGDTVTVPAGVEHWHGAADDGWYSHLVVEVPGTQISTEWLEPSVP